MNKVGENCAESFAASIKITQPLINEILNQSDCVPHAEDVSKAKLEAVQEMKAFQTEKSATIKNSQSQEMQRNLEQLSEPGASSWLGALPSREHGFCLTKSEFQDALCLRYKKPIKNLPSQCPCGAPFNVTHAINCMCGGFVVARHNNIMD